MAYFGETHNQRLATISGIDLKTTGQTTLYTVPTGKTLFVVALLIRATAATTVTVAPTVRAGKASGYTEFVGATALTGLDTTGKYTNLATASALLVSQSFAAAEVLKLDVTVGATATTLTGEVTVIGYLL